jgi:hypothetical protein
MKLKWQKRPVQTRVPDSNRLFQLFIPSNLVSLKLPLSPDPGAKNITEEGSLNYINQVEAAIRGRIGSFSSQKEHIGL